MGTLVIENTTADKPKTKLLSRVRGVIRLKHYTLRAERRYCDWIKRFIRCHRMRHPVKMAELEMGDLFYPSLAIAADTILVLQGTSASPSSAQNTPSSAVPKTANAHPSK
jgi:hypothetical protein